MFTGIIENIGKVITVQLDNTNIHFELECAFVSELKVDQSVAHNGVCLTVTKCTSSSYWVTAIDETLQKTNLSTWKVGTLINLERCMVLGGRLDGHIVQGHVDQIGTCMERIDQKGSWLYTFSYDATKGNVTIEKGSVTINGISLTVVNSQKDRFSVAIIPYTFEHTNMHAVHVNDTVNIEFDVIGKYVSRLMQ